MIPINNIIFPSVSFEVVDLLYTPAHLDNEGRTNIGNSFYAIYPRRESTIYYIVDLAKSIHANKHELTIERITRAELDTLFNATDQTIILAKIKQHVRDPKINTWEDLALWTYKTIKSLRPEGLYYFFDVANCAIKPEWNTLVDSVIAYKAIKDPTIYLVHKATLPRGYVMHYQPHSIILAPLSVGKTSFAKQLGLWYERVTANALSATARWKDDVSYGPFNDQYYALTIEQIESQNIENALGRLINFLDEGVGHTRAGGTQISYRGAAPLIITGNGPVNAPRSKKLSRFRELLVPYLVYNNTHALGKRFGIIAYGEYQRIKSILENNVPVAYNQTEQTDLFKIFRAVEEEGDAWLHKFWNDEAILNFIMNAKVYTDEDKKVVESCEFPEVRDFWLGHMNEAYYHIAGAALNCAVVDCLPLFAALTNHVPALTYEIVRDKIFSLATDYLQKIKEININSLKYMLS